MDKSEAKGRRVTCMSNVVRAPVEIPRAESVQQRRFWLQTRTRGTAPPPLSACDPLSLHPHLRGMCEEHKPQGTQAREQDKVGLHASTGTAIRLQAGAWSPGHSVPCKLWRGHRKAETEGRLGHTFRNWSAKKETLCPPRTARMKSTPGNTCATVLVAQSCHGEQHGTTEQAGAQDYERSAGCA